MYYVTHLSQRPDPEIPGSGDPFALDLERREFIREVAVRMFILQRSLSGAETSAHLQAARCWRDAEAMWAERPSED